jgi:SET family sugar efflux transporter-like MFS transporter
MRIFADVKLFIAIKGAGKLLLAIFLYGIGTGILAPMNAIYLRDSIGLMKGEIASIFAVSLFLNMCITLMVGILSDRMKSKKRLPLIAAVLCIIGLLIYMRADAYVPALIGMAIATAPSGLIMGQLFAMARNHFTAHAPDIVEMAQIWLRAGFSVGFFTGLLVGANVFLLASFQGVLWGNVIGYVCLFTLLLFYREVKIKQTDSRPGQGEPLSLLMLVALLLLSTSDAIRGLYFPLVVYELFGKPQLISYLWSAQAVFELFFMTMAGYWAAKYGSKRIIFLGGLLALFTYMTYSFNSSIIVFFLVQPVYSFFVSILYGVAMGYVQRMFVHRTGFGSSLYVVISQTASLIGYFLPLMVTGITPAIFIIPSVLVLISLLIIGKVILTEKKRVQQAVSGSL